MGKKEFVVRRILQIVVLYFVVATMLFALFKLSPGNPLVNFVSLDMTPQQMAAVSAAYGLNDPWYIQYGKWLVNVATLNFGVSYSLNQPVWDVISHRFWNTFILMDVALIIGYLFALPFGAYLAWNRGSTREQFGVVVGLISRSAPVFWTGLIAVWLLSVKWGLFPSGGMQVATVEYPSSFALYTSVDFLRHLVLPSLVQGFYYFSLPLLLMRNSMLDVLNEDFVEFAELKGIGSRRVMLWHAARNALLPIVTAFATGSARAVGLSVVIETVFDWPGLGRTLVYAVTHNDYPLAMGSFLLLAMIVIFANFLADLAYGYLDPRVTYN